MNEQPAEQQLTEALDEVWEAHQASYEPEVEAKPAEQPDQPDQPRAADGKFAPKEAEQSEVSAEAPEKVETAPEKTGPEPEKAASAPEKAEEAEDAPAKAEAPGNLPRAVRDEWGALSEQAQTALKSSQDELNRKLSDMTRQQQGIGPIFDAVKRANAELPAMKDMTPQQIADQAFELSKWSQALQSDPVGSLLHMAQHHGAVDALKARLTGEQQSSDQPDLQREIAGLKQTIAQLQDPSRIEQRIEQRFTEQNVNAEVQAFAQTKPDWGDVEPILADFVPIAQTQNPGATNAQILEAAYDMAVYATPALRERKLAEANSAAERDQKARAAQAAASLNVRPNGSGGSPPMTLDQELGAIWTKHHSG